MNLSKLLVTQPLPVWRAYLKLKLILTYGNLLAPAYAQPLTDFDNTVFQTKRGSEQKRSMYAIQFVDRSLGELTGRAYADKFFPEKNREAATNIVKTVVNTYIARLQKADWLEKDTRDNLISRLRSMRFNIGYPDEIDDYSSLHLKKDELVHNTLEIARFGYKRMLARVGKPASTSDGWPAKANEYYFRYDTNANALTITASALQSPTFIMGAEASVNYGALGWRVASAISTELLAFLTKTDRAALVTRLEPFRKIYAGAGVTEFNRPVTDKMIIDQLVGDVIGLSVAYEAWQKDSNKQTIKQIGEFTPVRAFLLSYAKENRQKFSDKLTNVVNNVGQLPLTNREKVYGVLSASSVFKSAFALQKGDRLFSNDTREIWFW